MHQHTVSSSRRQYQPAIAAGLAVLALVSSSCYRARYQPAQAPKQMAATVVEGSFTVNARTYTPFKIVVSREMTHARIEGSFTASGANNDIEVMLLDNTHFLNWQNRHTFTAAYESGRVTAGHIRASLPLPGTYYVVFSNRFSLLSRKTVVADVSLHFNSAM